MGNDNGVEKPGTDSEEIPVAGEEIKEEVAGDEVTQENDEKPGTEKEPDTEGEIDPRDQKIAEMNARIEELNELVEKKFAEKQPEEEGKREEPKPLTPEDKVRITKEFGFVRKQGEDGQSYLDVNEWQLIDRITRMVNDGIQIAIQEGQKSIHQNVGDMRFDASVNSLKTTHPDISQYTDEIRNFLKRRYPPQQHGDPKLIEEAYYYAKGKGIKNIVKKAVDNSRRNAQVVRASGSSSGSRPSGTKTLTAEQKEIARKSGMSEEEYAKYL